MVVAPNRSSEPDLFSPSSGQERPSSLASASPSPAQGIVGQAILALMAETLSFSEIQATFSAERRSGGRESVSVMKGATAQSCQATPDTSRFEHPEEGRGRNRNGGTGGVFRYATAWRSIWNRVPGVASPHDPLIRS
jgi:hypothetical protein